MSVKISTKERLNTNIYNKMIIREVDGNYLVNVSNENKDSELTSLSCKVSDGLKKMADINKIICIVESFLNSTLISYIEFGIGHTGYTEKFLKVGGTRTLYLYICNPELIRILVKMIKDKYNIDRYKFCDINTVDNSYSISLNRKESSYGKSVVPCEECCRCICDSVCSTYIEFKLMYIQGNIAGFDKKFIERFIYDKLWEYGDVASIVERTRDVIVGGDTKLGECIDSYDIVCGDLVIKFNCTDFSKSYVFNLCNNIVNRYNCELLEVTNYKKRQLKMEGF